MSKLKKQKSNKISEIARLGALMEHVDEKVTLVAEGVSGLNTRMDRVERTLDQHTEMIGNLAVNLEIVKSDVEFMKIP
ncbi:MAG: hypothetical protein HYX20_00710 [Candidatus Yanofskybacteria bacterium]|nr:hypothetical protein [Candidatus Yanofskybacteria bacterium]